MTKCMSPGTRTWRRNVERGIESAIRDDAYRASSYLARRAIQGARPRPRAEGARSAGTNVLQTASISRFVTKVNARGWQRAPAVGPQQRTFEHGPDFTCVRLTNDLPNGAHRVSA